MEHHDESECLYMEPCPACGSRNNLGRYSDGHGYCFGCHHWEPGDESTVNQTTRSKPMSDKDLLPVGEFQSWSSRGLTAETATKWGMSRSEWHDKPVRVFNYRNLEGKLVAQKVRTKGKDFHVRGNLKAGGLYGQHLWRDSGKKVVITEGELDAMSVSQVQGHKWPVVSIPTGSAGAKKSLQNSLEWLSQFEEVILMFDQDDPGREATKDCVSLFKPGQCKIAKLPLKDANEMLKEGKGKEIIDAIWGAKTYRPDGIVTIDDVLERVLEPVVVGLPWFSPKLTELTYGRRYGEIYAFGGGTGGGKTDWLIEQMGFDLTQGEAVGGFWLEQNPVETIKRTAGKLTGKRFHIPDDSWTDDDLLNAVTDLTESGNLFLYDNFGATDWEVIKTTIRYLTHAEGVRLYYLDHLTALAAAETDERKALERIMAEMASLAKELQIIIHFVSHLATPEGKPHEEGGRVMIRHFKGSRAIGFWSHFMFGIERNQQETDEQLRKVQTFRVLKDRNTGTATGELVFFTYDTEKGRLVETDDNPFDDPDLSTNGGIPHDDSDPF